MVGENRMYHPDSIEILNAPDKWRLTTEDSMMYFNYGLVSSNEAYYLKLSSDVVDTVNLNIKITEVDCGAIKDIAEFYYSGAKVTIDDNRVVVIKN